MASSKKRFLTARDLPGLLAEQLEDRVLFDAVPVPPPSDGGNAAQEVPEPVQQQAAEAQPADVQRELVLVNSNVQDVNTLLAELIAERGEQAFEMVLLDAERDGVEQITELLAGSSGDYSAIHILSHGQDGNVQLGNTWLGSANITAYAGQIAQWGNAFTGNGDLLFYGCNLAETADGRQFLNELAALTGADVAASNDATGHADFGGDWELEVQQGTIEAASLAATHWEGRLAPPVVDLNGTGTGTNHTVAIPITTGSVFPVHPNTAFVTADTNLTSMTLAFTGLLNGGNEYAGILDEGTGTYVYFSLSGAQTATVTVEGTALTVTKSGGTLTITRPAGTITTAAAAAILQDLLYGNIAGASGTEGVRTLTVTVNDGSTTAAAQTKINVGRPPVGTNDVNSTLANNVAGITGNVLSNDTDPTPGDSLSVTFVHGYPASVGVPYSTSYGTITMLANGSYTYNVDVNNNTVLALSAGQSLTDIIAYEVSDVFGNKDTAFLTVTINGVVDLPEAYDNANSVRVAHNETATGNVILDHDGFGLDSGDRPLTQLIWEAQYANGANINGTSRTVNGVTLSFANTDPEAIGTVNNQIVTYGTNGGHSGYLLFNTDRQPGDSNPPVPTTTTITFSTPVVGLDFTLSDIDWGQAGTWQDQFTITGTRNGEPVSFDAQVAGTVITVGDDTFYGTGSVPATEAHGNVHITFTGAVDRVTIAYTYGPDANNPATAGTVENQIAGVSDLAWLNTAIPFIASAGGNAVGQTGSATFATTYGTITVQGNGSYSYTVNPANPTVAALTDPNTLVDSVTYVLQDAAGNQSTAVLNITVNPTYAPTLTLDANNSTGGADDGNFATTFTENGAPVSVVDADAAAVDAENALQSLTFVVSGNTDGANEIITVSSQLFALDTNRTLTAVTIPGVPYNLTVAYVASTGVFTITRTGGGIISGGEMTTILKAITYQNSSENPTSGDRTLDFTLTDNSGQTAHATSTVTVVPVDDAPVLITPNLAAGSSSGDDFWIAFKTVAGLGLGDVKFHVAGVPGTVVTVEGPGVPGSFNFTIPAGGVLTIEETSFGVSAGTLANATGTVNSNKSVHVTASADISLYAYMNVAAFTDELLVLPTAALGQEYILTALPGFTAGATLVGTQNGTNVTLTDPTGTVTNIVLNEGDAYVFQQANAVGTVITADKPIAAIGDNIGTVFFTGRGGDYLAEQLLPLEGWSDHALVAPTTTESRDIIFAGEDGVEVSINGSVVATLNQGEYYALDIPSVAEGAGGYGYEVTATGKIQVVKVLKGDRPTSGPNAGTLQGDPGMAFLGPPENYLAEYTFFGVAGLNNTATLIAADSSTSTFLLDGNPLTATWTAIGTSGYSWAHVPVAVGAHQIAADAPFGLTMQAILGANGSVWTGGTSTTPLGYQGTEDVPLALTGLAVDDVDANGADITYTLSVGQGLLTLLDNVVGGVTAGQISNNGTATVTLTGTLAEINATLAALNGVVYQMPHNQFGSDTLTITANDLGNTGTGGPLSAVATLPITIAEVGEPEINLDPNNTTGGADDANHQTIFHELTGPVSLAELSIGNEGTITDSDSAQLASLTITAAGMLDGPAETLLIGGTAFPLNANGGPTTVTVGGVEFEVTVSNGGTTISVTPHGAATASTAAFQAVLRNVTYNNFAVEPTHGDRTFSFIASDGVDIGPAVVATVAVLNQFRAPGAVNSIEDSGPVSLNINNTGATGTFTIDLTGAPTGTTLTVGSDPDLDGIWTVNAVDIVNAALNLPQHYSGSFAVLVAHGLEVEEVTVNIQLEADAPTLTLGDVSGIHDTAISIPFTVNGLGARNIDILDLIDRDPNSDEDGPETLTALVISNIPVGATLRDGTRTFTATAGNTSIDIVGWTLANLNITPPALFYGEFDLQVAATSTEDVVTANLSDVFRSGQDVNGNGYSGTAPQIYNLGGTYAVVTKIGDVPLTVTNGMRIDANEGFIIEFYSDLALTQPAEVQGLQMAFIEIDGNEVVTFAATNLLGNTVLGSGQNNNTLNGGPTRVLVTGSSLTSNTAGDLASTDPKSQGVMTYANKVHRVQVNMNGTLGSPVLLKEISIGGTGDFLLGGTAAPTPVYSATSTGAFTVTVVNNPPMIDLDSANAGSVNYSASFTENGAPLAVAKTDATVSDVAENDLASLHVTLGGFVDGNAEQLRLNATTLTYGTAFTSSTVAVGGVGYNLTVNYDGANQLHITRTGGGIISATDATTIVRALKYQHTSDVPTAGNRTLTFVATDTTGLSSNPARSTLTVVPVNDVPVIDLNSTATPSDLARNFSLVFTEGDAPKTVADVDADSLDLEQQINRLTITVGGLFDGNSEIVTIGGRSFPLNTTVGAPASVNIGGTPFSVTFNAATKTFNILSALGPGDVIPDADLDALLRSITYENASQNPTAGNRTLTFVATDSGGASSNAAISTITVRPVNDPPIAQPDVASTNENTLLNANVLSDNGHGADSDVDSSILSVSQVNGANVVSGATITLPSGALLIMNSNGTYTYDPNGQFEGLQNAETATDSFTYTLSDGDGGTSTATVTVTITGVNDAPIAQDDEESTNENSSLSDSVLSDNGNGLDTDIEGDALSISQVNGANITSGATITLPSGALLIMNSNGTYTYNPNGQFEHLSTGETATESFTYTLSDGQGGTATATVTITINGINDVPVARADGPVTVVGGTISNLNVLSNDSDPESQPLTISALIDPNNGSPVTYLIGTGVGEIPVGTPLTLASGTKVTVLADGTLNVFSAPTTTGQEEFEYTISDGHGGSATATVFLDRQAPPIVNLDPLNTTGGADDANYRTVFNEVTGPVSIAADAPGATATITDADDSNLTELTLTITGLLNGPQEVLRIAGTNFPLVNSTTTVVTINGTSFDVAIVTSNGGTMATITITPAGPPLEASRADYAALLNSITYQNNAPEPTHGDRLVTVQATDNDGNHSPAVTTTLSVPNLFRAPANVTGDEDVSGGIPLDIVPVGATNPYLIDLSNAPTGTLLSVGIDLGGGLWSVAATDIVNAAVIPPANYSGHFDITITNGEEVEQVSVTAVPVADGTTIVLSDASGDEDAVIPIPISTDGSTPRDVSVLDDTDHDIDANEDSPEQLTALVLSSIPVGATISDGVHTFTATLGSTSVDIVAWSLTDLAITPPLNFNGTFTLALAATTREPENGAPATGNSTFDVVVNPVNDPPVLANVDATTSYTQNRPAVVVDPSISISDVDDTHLESATITISNVDRLHDLLTIDPLALAAINPALTVIAYNPATGELQLTGTATLAEYAAALQLIQFSSSSSVATDRNLSFVVNDGDANSNVGSAAIDCTRDTTPPTAPSVDTISFDSGISGSDGITNETTPVIYGTFDEADTAALTVAVTDGLGNSMTYVLGIDPELTSDGNGNWALDLTAAPPLSDGPLNVTAVAADLAGNTSSDPTSNEFLIDTDTSNIAPPTVQTLVTNDQTPTITGTWDDVDAETLLVTVNGQTFELGVDPELTTDGSGNWTLNLNGNPLLAEGLHDVSVTTGDVAGNTVHDATTDEVEIDITVPEIPTVNVLVTNDVTPTLTGTWSEGDATILQVTVNGLTYVLNLNSAPGSDPQLTTDGNGHWTLNLDGQPAVSPGRYNVTATNFDPAGNAGVDATIGELTIDVTPPLAATAPPNLTDETDTGSSNTDDLTHDTLPTFNGNGGEPGSTATIYAQPTDANGTPVGPPVAIGTAIVAANGSYSVPTDADNPFPDGHYHITVTFTDLAGNESTPSPTLAIEVDTTAPDQLAIDSPIEGDDFSNIVETPDVTIRGTGAEPTSIVMVTLVDQNGTSLGPIAAAVNADGTWILPDQDLSGLVDGPITVTAIETDAAGNVGDPVTGQFEKDTQPPTALAIDGPIEGDDFSNSQESPDVTISGTGAEPTSTVAITLVDQNGNTLGPIQATVDSYGNWLLPDQDLTALVDGPITVTAIETDRAGNPGSPVTAVFTKDTQAPGQLAINAPIEGDDFSNIVESPDVSINGTGAEPTSSVAVTLTDTNGNSLGPITATVNVDGTWSIVDQDLTALVDGPITVTAVETDLAGNVGVPVTAVFEKDTIAPTGIAIDGAATNTIEEDHVVNAAEAPQVAISGNGVEPTSTVEVTIVDQNGTTLGPIVATVNSDGTWSIPLQDFTGLVDGPVTITALETDAAGNPGPIEETTVTLDSTPPPKPPVTDLTDATDSAGASNTDDLTNVQLPDFQGPTGTGTPGDTVSLYVTPTDEFGVPSGPPQLVGTAAVNADGSYIVSVAPGNPLPEGFYNVMISMTDPAGNEGEWSDPLLIAVDLTEPTGLAIDPALEGDDVINAAEVATVNVTGAGVEPTSTVSVSITDRDGNTLGPVAATVNLDGTWSTPDLDLTTLADGPLTIVAIETDAAGNVGEPVTTTLELDTTPPATPVIAPNLTDGTDTAGDSNTDDLTFNNTPTFDIPVGTGTPGDTATLYIDGQPVGTATVQADGSFSIEIAADSPLSEGFHDVTYTFTDPAGNESAQSPVLTIEVDTVAPATPLIAPNLTDATDTAGDSNTDDLTFNNTPTFDVPVGTGTPGDTATLYIDGQPVGTATVQPDGSISIEIAADSPLTEGFHDVTYTFTDPAGNESGQSPELTIEVDTVAPATPLIAPNLTDGTDTAGDSNTDDLTFNNTPTFDIPVGTGTPGDTATLYIDGQPVGTATVQPDGSFSIEITADSPLSEGFHDVTYTFTDPAGNESGQSPVLTIEVDTTAPTAPSTPDMTDATDSAGDSSTDDLTNDSTPDFSGTGTPGDTVTLYVDGTPVGSALVQPDGTYTATPDAPLADGPHDVQTTFTDPAGNEGPLSGVLPIIIDTTAPELPLIAPDLTDATDTGTSPTDDLTNNSTPTFSVPPGTAVPGDTVTLYVDGNPVGTATVDIDGSYVVGVDSRFPLTDGPHEVTYTFTDPAGNESEQSPALTIEVDTTAPVQLAIDGAVEQTIEVDHVVNLAESSTVTISGTGVEPTSTVVVTITDQYGNTLGPITGTVNSEGTWTIPDQDFSTLIDGPVTISAVETDAAGNAGPSVETVVELDTTPPLNPVNAPDMTDETDSAGESHSDNLTDNTTPTFTGTDGEPGSTVTLYIDGTPVGTATVNPDGSYTVSVDPENALADGPHDVTVTFTDPAGNESGLSPVLSIIVDTVAPALLEIAGPIEGDDVSNQVESPDVSISGTGAEPTSTVAVTLTDANGQTLGPIAAIVNADGTWVLPDVDVTSLVDGPITVTAFETDAAGNAGMAVTVEFIKDTLPPSSPIAPDMLSETDSGDSPTDDLTNDATPTLTSPPGTGIPGDTVTLYLDGNPVATGVVDADGSYTITLTTPLTDGPHNVSATFTDPAGNESAESLVLMIEIDTTPPAPPTIIGPVEGDDVVNAAEVNDVLISGTAEPFSTLELTIDDGNPETPPVVVTVPVDEFGNWSLVDHEVDLSGLDDGPLIITAISTDPAGNVSPPATATITLDTTPPLTPPVTDLTAATDSAGSSNTDDLTNVTTPSFTAPAGTGVSGDLVTLYVDGVPVGTATVDADGGYTVSVGSEFPMTEGPHAVQVNFTDPAGNAGPLSAVLVVTIDTIAPAELTIDEPIAAENVVNAAESTGLAISGAGVEPTSTVAVTFTDAEGNTVGPIAATVLADGTWTLPPTDIGSLVDGPLTVSVIETDATGNVAAPVEVVLLLDATPPRTPAIAPDLTDATDSGTSPTDDLTNVSAPTFTAPPGTGVSGDTVTLYVDGIPVGTATVNPDGSYTISVDPESSLADGSHTVTVTFTDPAGNESGMSPELPIVVDTLPPATPSAPDLADESDSGFDNTDDLTHVTQPDFEGHGTPGDTVTLLIDGVPAGTAVVQPDGTFVVTPENPLTNGEHIVQVQFIDPAGNSTPPSPELPIVIDTQAPNPEVVVATDSGPDFVTGTGEPNAQVVLFGPDGEPLTDLQGTVLTTFVAEDGTWTISGISPQIFTGQIMTVQQTDPAGNISTAQVKIQYFGFDSFTNQSTNPEFETTLDRLFNGQRREVLLSAIGRSLGSQPIISGSARPGTILVAYLYGSDGSVLGREEIHVDPAGNWLVQFHADIQDDVPRIVVEHVATEAVPIGMSGFTLTETTYTQLSFGAGAGTSGSAPGDIGAAASESLEQEHTENLNPLRFLRG